MQDNPRLTELEFLIVGLKEGIYEVTPRFTEYFSYPPELRREGDQMVFAPQQSVSFQRINLPEELLSGPFAETSSMNLRHLLFDDFQPILSAPAPGSAERMIRITYVFDNPALDLFPWESMTSAVLRPLDLPGGLIVLRRYPAKAGERTGKFDLPLNVALADFSGYRYPGDVGEIAELLFDDFTREARTLGGIEWGPFNTMKTGEAQHVILNSFKDSSLFVVHDLLDNMAATSTAKRAVTPPRLLTLHDVSPAPDSFSSEAGRLVRKALEAGADAVLAARSYSSSREDLSNFFSRFYRKVMHNWPLDQSVWAAHDAVPKDMIDSIFGARRDGEFGLLLTRAVVEALPPKTSAPAPERERKLRVKRGRGPREVRRKIDARGSRLKTDLLRDVQYTLESKRESVNNEVELVLGRIHFDEEQHGVDAVVRARETVRVHSEEIKKFQKSFSRLNNVDPQGLQEDLVRWTNLWITEGDPQQSLRTIETFDPLVTRRPYNLHLQIGQRKVEAIVSEQFNEEAIKEVLELLGQVTLDVMFFSTENDFQLLGNELEDPAVESAGAHDKPPQDRFKLRSVARARLVLPRYGSSNELRVIIIPGEPGHRRLRTCIYYRNVLLQSVVIEAEVAAVDAEPKAEGEAREKVITGRTMDYMATIDFALLNELPEPSLTLFANDDGAGTHWVGAFSSGDTDAFDLKSGDMRVFDDATLQQRGGDLRNVLAEIEGPSDYKLTATMPLSDDDVKFREKYFSDLAISGRRLFHDLFNVTGGDNAARLENFRNTTKTSHIISIARCGSNSVTVPWAALYTNSLDVNSSEPKSLCHIFKKQLYENKWNIPDGKSSPMLVETHDKLDDPKACRSQIDCPLNGLQRRTTICPFGFWGFLHQIEQPLQQVKPTAIDTVPTELKDYNFGQTSFLTRSRKDRVKVAIGAYGGIPDVKDHSNDIQAIAKGAAIDLAYRDNRDQIISALAGGGQHVYYFYCHGESDKAHKIFRLKVGEPGTTGFIESADLDPEEIKWQMPKPLFVMNGCDSVAITPDETHGFLSTLKTLGASGIVGTEIKVWTQLARPVGLLLLTYLLDGMSIGEAFLEMRKYLLRQLNPLGLVYSYYSPATLHFHDPDKCGWCASH